MEELVWSKSRVRRFKRCRREYFLHFYASAGGFAPDADTETRELWFYKNLQSADYYLYRLIRRILYKAFCLQWSAMECQDELLKRWSLDMAEERITFYEQVYHGMTFNQIRDAAAESVINAGKILIHSELAPFMRHHKFRTVFIDQPLEFMLGDIIIYTAPFAMLCSGQEYIFLELTGDRMLDSAAMHRYYACRIRRIPAIAVKSSFYNITTGELWSPEFEAVNFSATAATIGEEVETIATAIPEEIIARKAYFAISGAPRDICSKCNFARVCRQS